MSTVISSNIVLSSELQTAENFGLICYQNIVTASNLTASSETVENPITNIANPATAFKWTAADTTEQTITITNEGSEIDYLGIASHNLNQFGLTVTVKFNGVTVINAVTVSDNQSILFLLNTAAPGTIEIIISGATQAPKIGVIYAGLALKLERKIYVGHTPLSYARRRRSFNGTSENGQYLGEVVVSESRQNSVTLNNLTPRWYRENLDPFFALKPRVPCFFAWRPDTYSDEVTFCWIEGDPQMSNQSPNGLVQASWTFRGLA